MTLRDQLEIVLASGLSVKTKGFQRWDVAYLLKSEWIDPYLDCEAVMTWESYDHEEWERLALIEVQANPTFTMCVCT